MVSQFILTRFVAPSSQQPGVFTPKRLERFFCFMFLPTKNLASPGSLDVGPRAAAQDHRRVSLHDRSAGHDLPLATRQREASVETELRI